MYALRTYFLNCLLLIILQKSQIHPSGMYVTLAMEPRFHVRGMSFKVQCLNHENGTL
jgi:hypothetical protein